MKVCAMTGLALTSILADSAYVKAAGNPWLPTSSFRSAYQEKEIGGTVKDAKGTLLPGVSVQIKGTTKGTQTNNQGAYRLPAKSGDVLVFSSIGFEPTEITVGNNDLVNVKLNENVKGLNELVVTALGVKKAAKSLTYSTQRIGNEELSTVKDANVMNSINGKAAGITISKSSSGVGGSVKVTLRGNKSAQASNQPLYVIDGIPMTNYTTQQPNSTWGGDGTTTTSPGRDGGDGISNLNPDDIESMTVLKGASAAALYGSQAANGVILITTKKGKSGVSKVEASSGITLDKIAYAPKFQNSYGPENANSSQSWGKAISGGGHDNVNEFFRTGNTWINSVNFSGGTEKAQSFFSYANTSASGVMPGNDLKRNNFTFRETAKFLNDKLTLDGNVNVITQTLDNGPVNGLYFNPLTGLYLFPRGNDITQYKNQYTLFDKTRQLDLQNWPYNEDLQQNPWWSVNKNPTVAKRNRTLASVSGKYDINDWLWVQARGNIDRTNDTYDAYIYAGTQGTLSGPNGRYITSDLTTTQLYGDLILNMNKSLGNNFKLNALVGTSINDQQTRGMTGESFTGDLSVANFFVLQNMTAGSQINTVPNNHSQLQAVFGSANLSFKDFLFLDVTGRNDWSSNLSFTPNGSYFYPSVGLSAMLHQLFNMPEPISYAKVRASYAIVGNTVPIYVTNPLSRLGAVGGTFAFNNRAPFTDLKPEKTKSLELGTEWRFLQNRLSLDLTYYKTNTTNQYFQIAVPPGTGYSFRFINAGNIQNAGIEILVGYNVIKNAAFSWNTSINYSQNRNKVIELAPNIDQFILTEAGTNNYASILAKDGSYGDIYGTILKRDENGKVIINADGKPLTVANKLIGNPTPKWQGGWSNNLTYKNFALNFLVDGKFGGKVMSLTQATLDKYGVSAATGDARNNGGVTVDGVDETTKKPVTKVDAATWYGAVGGRDGVTGEYMYDGTVVRLREASLGYSIPAKALGNGFVRSLRMTLIGRNLWYISRKAPYDPEIAMSTGNGLAGVDIFSMPATRSFGFSLNVGF